VSVVVPCRDGGSLLGGMLESLTRDPLAAVMEVIVADNGSTDDSVAVARSFAARLPGLRVVDASAEVGRTAACNAGAAVATGDVLVFVDVDDEVGDGYVSAMARALADADLAAGFIDGDRLNEPWVARTRSTGLEEDGLSHYLGFLPIAGGCAMGVRRDVWSSLGGMHVVPYAEDIDFSWRAQLAGYRLVAAPGATLHYRYRDSLRGIFEQAVKYGAAQPLLLRLYESDGMPRRGAKVVLRDVRDLLRDAVRVRDKGDAGRWLFLAGILAGRVVGSIRHRRLYV
jgi:GT2 family glycosyltransferase